MDFIKSLLVYMGVTYAVTMQGVPAPSETPTPPPQAIVTPAPGQTAAPGVSPAPGVTVVAPELTPNKSYRLLKQRSRGEPVRKLQARLIELGYLGGTVDGVYGLNTRRAVMRFQEKNGLTKDGVAGDQTLTILYESPNVVANTKVTAAPSSSPAVLPSPAASPEAADSKEKNEAGETAAPASTDEPVADAEELTLLKGAKIVFNDMGAPMAVIRKVDGVNQKSDPRVYQDSEGGIHLSIYDLGQNAPGFTLATEDQTYALTFDDVTLTLYWDEAEGWSADVGDEILSLSVGDVVRQGDDVVIAVSLLERAMKATATWDEDESTLILRIRSKGEDQKIS